MPKNNVKKTKVEILNFFEHLILILSYLFYAIESSVISIASVGVYFSEHNFFTNRTISENELTDAIKIPNQNMLKAIGVICILAIVLEIIKYFVKRSNNKTFIKNFILLELIIYIIMLALNCAAYDYILIIGLIIRSILDYFIYMIQNK